MNNIDFNIPAGLLHYLKNNTGLGGVLSFNESENNDSVGFYHINEKQLEQSLNLDCEQPFIYDKPVLITFSGNLDVNRVVIKIIQQSSSYLSTKFSFGNAIICYPLQEIKPLVGNGLDIELCDSFVDISEWLEFCRLIKLNDSFRSLRKDVNMYLNLIPPGGVIWDDNIENTIDLTPSKRGVVEIDVVNPVDSTNVNQLDIRLIDKWSKKEFISERRLSHLSDVTVVGGQIVKREHGQHESGQVVFNSSGCLINQSFSIMDNAKTLPSDIFFREEEGFFQKRIVRTNLLLGSSFFIGSIHPHFGHFLLEGISRLDKALIQNFDHYIVYENHIPSYVLDFFEILGIDVKKIICVGSGEAFTCEKLVLADPAYISHYGASLDILDVWDKICIQDFSDSLEERKVFLSRKGIAGRKCLNEDFIENIAMESGYEVIRPHELSIIEQLKLMSSVTSLAGLVGSQMYLAAFAKNCFNLKVIAPNDFYLPDDYIISNLRGTQLKVCLGTAIGNGVNGSWSCDEKVIESLFQDL
ncbi:TPA: glycosyltransferase family 61 protein [Vibrio parahaemolyticus]|uniref:glycosyltransferase family 61 protein n=1 Tax=Vibrio atypicus TaxID=558271 RepID=UPI0037368A7E|nr:glycosyltransferase family 61 protein [Vibrio parahaemolyticus]